MGAFDTSMSVPQHDLWSPDNRWSDDSYPPAYRPSNHQFGPDPVLGHMDSGTPPATHTGGDDGGVVSDSRRSRWGGRISKDKSSEAIVTGSAPIEARHAGQSDDDHNTARPDASQSYRLERYRGPLTRGHKIHLGFMVCPRARAVGQHRYTLVAIVWASCLYGYRI
jgi:hypothetical protein